MNETDLKRMFPNASAATLRRNRDADDAGLRAAVGPQPARPLGRGAERETAGIRLMKITCLNCKTVFEAFARSNRKFCSPKCAYTSNEWIAGVQKEKVWSKDEVEALVEIYRLPDGYAGRVEMFAKQIGRTHIAVKIKAFKLGLGARRGLFKRTEEAKQNMSIAQKKLMTPERVKRLVLQLKEANKDGSSFRGRHHTKEVREASSIRMKKWIAENGHPRGTLGKVVSQETRDKISKSNTGRKHLRKWVVAQQKSVLAKYGKIAPPNCGKRSWKSGWRVINGRKIYARSRWEANYARFLQFQQEHNLIIAWEHEPQTFWFDGVRRGCCSYLPDFKITKIDQSIEFHEVKGWMDNKSKTKLKRMAKYYPTVTLRVIDGEWFKSQKILSKIIPEWEQQ